MLFSRPSIRSRDQDRDICTPWLSKTNWWNHMQNAKKTNRNLLFIVYALHYLWHAILDNNMYQLRKVSFEVLSRCRYIQTFAYRSILSWSEPLSTVMLTPYTHLRHSVMMLMNVFFRKIHNEHHCIHDLRASINYSRPKGHSFELPGVH